MHGCGIKAQPNSNATVAMFIVCVYYFGSSIRQTGFMSATFPLSFSLLIVRSLVRSFACLFAQVRHVRSCECVICSTVGRVHARFRYVSSLSARVHRQRSTPIMLRMNVGVLQQATGKFWALVIFITLPDEDAFHLPNFHECVRHKYVIRCKRNIIYTRPPPQLNRISTTTEIFAGH